MHKRQRVIVKTAADTDIDHFRLPTSRGIVFPNELVGGHGVCLAASNRSPLRNPNSFAILSKLIIILRQDFILVALTFGIVCPGSIFPVIDFSKRLS
jgi:hypothetical protein